VAFIGWGAINAHVGALLARRRSAIDVVAIATLDTPEARASIPKGVRFLDSPEKLIELAPDIVVEAAGRAAIDRWAEAALAASPAMIIASTSAFCDDALLPRLVAVAETHGSRILIPSGAIGAVDALASAAVLGLDEVTHQIVKPPAAWKGTLADQLLDLATLTERTVFLRAPRVKPPVYIRKTPMPRWSPPWPVSASTRPGWNWWRTRHSAVTATASSREAGSVAWTSHSKTTRFRPIRNHRG